MLTTLERAKVNQLAEASWAQEASHQNPADRLQATPLGVREGAGGHGLFAGLRQDERGHILIGPAPLLLARVLLRCLLEPLVALFRQALAQDTREALD